MARLPKPSDWESKDRQELLNASVRGMNMLQRLPVLFEKYFEWAKGFVFGFFSEDDVNEARSYGWEHVQTAFLLQDGVLDEYNSTVSTPFGLIDHGGVIKWRDNFLMIMPKDFRKKQMGARHQAYLDSTEKMLRTGSYVPAEDPQYGKMKALAEEISLENSEEYTVRTGAEEKPKRGRPKKE